MGRDRGLVRPGRKRGRVDALPLAAFLSAATGFRVFRQPAYRKPKIPAFKPELGRMSYVLNEHTNLS
jgi:hypothetical protein